MQYSKDQYCDPETGLCTPSNLNDLQQIAEGALSVKTEIIYVGDPMCSWCWGISPALTQLRDHYAHHSIAYRIVVGGLRLGGGDPWNDQMKDFLKHHWQQVNERSGQPFGYELFNRKEFNYDTEPTCRAVVAVRPLLIGKEMEFFEAVQRKFYVDSQDPSKSSFYASICDDLGINYGEFISRFESDLIKQETIDEFNLNRSWGVQGYPSVLLLHNNKLYQVAHGYSTFDAMKAQIEHIIKPEA